MKQLAFGTFAVALAFPAAALAQAGGAIAPQTQRVVTPVAPPSTVVTQIGPNAFVVTPVPGLTASTTVKVQRFSDYDGNRDGLYSPMEFAQAIYFLATSDPVAGNPRLPADDRFLHRGAPLKMRSENAVALLNATADEFSKVDLNRDWRVSAQELAVAALM